MGNSGELLINVVRTNKPKALTGLNQKVSGEDVWTFRFQHADYDTTGGEADPNPSMGCRRNVVNP